MMLVTPEPWSTEKTVLEVEIPLLTSVAWYGQINHWVSASTKCNEGQKQPVK